MYKYTDLLAENITVICADNFQMSTVEILVEIAPNNGAAERKKFQVCYWQDNGLMGTITSTCKKVQWVAEIASGKINEPYYEGRTLRELGPLVEIFQRVCDINEKKFPYLPGA